MYFIIQGHEYHKFPELLDQMFRLRKKVFFDQLGWAVPVKGDREQDEYDNLRPAYLVWTDTAKTRLYGMMRLMPTTGPTLMFDVFRETFPEGDALMAPGIWEGTRMCINEEVIAADFPALDPGRAFCLLLLALCECALHHGIHTMLSNYEPHLRRVYRRAGVEVQELGRADGYGKHPVCCGAFEVSESVLDTMRSKLSVTKPLFHLQHINIKTIDNSLTMAA